MLRNGCQKAGMVVHACNLSTRKAEDGFQEFKACATYNNNQQQIQRPIIIKPGTKNL